jgi:hypothetical protein
MVDIKSNEVPGKYQSIIMVTYLGQSSLIHLNQENTFPFHAQTATGHHRLFRKGFLSKRTVLIIAGVAIATLVIIFVAHRCQTSTIPPPTSSITITPGTGTVGAH